MANNIQSSPWILDTPSATPVKPGITWLTGFVFRDYTGGVASAAVFKDWRGIIIARLPGSADGAPVSEAWLPAGREAQKIRDLALTAIDSGVVEVIVV